MGAIEYVKEKARAVGDFLKGEAYHAPGLGSGLRWRDTRRRRRESGTSLEQQAAISEQAAVRGFSQLVARMKTELETLGSDRAAIKKLNDLGYLSDRAANNALEDIGHAYDGIQGALDDVNNAYEKSRATHAKPRKLKGYNTGLEDYARGSAANSAPAYEKAAAVLVILSSIALFGVTLSGVTGAVVGASQVSVSVFLPVVFSLLAVIGALVIARRS